MRGLRPCSFSFGWFFLLHTTALEQLVVKLLDLQHRQLFQLHTAKLWKDVVINRVMVKLFGRISHLRLDVNGVPQLQPLFECIAPCFHWVEFLLSSMAVRNLSLTSACVLPSTFFRDRLSVCIIARRISAFPASVFPLPNVAFAVGSSFRHRVYLLRFRLADTITTSTAESQVQFSVRRIFVPHPADSASR